MWLGTLSLYSSCGTHALVCRDLTGIFLDHRHIISLPYVLDHPQTGQNYLKCPSEPSVQLISISDLHCYICISIVLYSATTNCSEYSTFPPASTHCTQHWFLMTSCVHTLCLSWKIGPYPPRSGAEVVPPSLSMSMLITLFSEACCDFHRGPQCLSSEC